MKANIFISVLVLTFLSVTTISAADPDKKYYTNEERNECGSIKEVTCLSNYDSTPLEKAVYHYGKDGELQQKILFKWDNNKGWVNYKKYILEYNDAGQILTMTFAGWNEKHKAWSTKPTQHIYDYNENGEFLSMKKIMNDDLKDQLFAKK